MKTEPESKTVVTDPAIRGGQPTVRGVPTLAIYERWVAGDTMAVLSGDYDIPTTEIEEAVRYQVTSSLGYYEDNDAGELRGLLNALRVAQEKKPVSTQMTLGKLIKVLQGFPPAAPVPNFIRAHSYSARAGDIAFMVGLGTKSAASLLNDCTNLIGIRVTLPDYSGTFSENTLVWLAAPGCTGTKLVSIDVPGRVVTEVEPLED